MAKIKAPSDKKKPAGLPPKAKVLHFKPRRNIVRTENGVEVLDWGPRK